MMSLKTGNAFSIGESSRYGYGSFFRSLLSSTFPSESF